MKTLLSGNEAIARGAYEAGVRFGTGYPGTPSTEILEAFATYKDVIAEWAPNEKVALEVGFGAAVGGRRTFVTMKHVGLNVAADPLFSAAYAGVNAGLVIISADDPGMHSSQNEQDNRHFARAAKIPLLEPSSSQEAKEFMKLAFELSEHFDIPVLVRLTTRISHSKTVCTLDEPQHEDLKPYRKNPMKNVLLPAYARPRHHVLEETLKKLADYGNKAFQINAIDVGSSDVGIITSGIAYQYSKEAIPEASFLKLGLSYPLPQKLIRYFAQMVKRLYIVEELEPFLEEQIRAMGIEVHGGKDIIPITGELNVERVAGAFRSREPGLVASEGTDRKIEVSVPDRPPTLCPGCGHRGVMYVLHKLHLTVTGDIGCYTLGALPPLKAMDTCLCMGASVSMAYGMEVAHGEKMARKTVAVIGDSTFIHSGITALTNIVYNQGVSTIIILDNHTTAMTGHQGHPGTGKNLTRQHAPEFDFKKLCEAIGVRRVRVVDPYNLEETETVVKEELSADETSVIIAAAPCVLEKKIIQGPPEKVILEKCTKCGVCFQLGCAGVGMENGEVVIDDLLCTGCTLCEQVCTFDAVIPLTEEGDHE